MSIVDKLQQIFSVYNVNNLIGVNADQFMKYILSCIDTEDSKLEGYTAEDLNRQRDLSVKFHWGHDHDFGSFKIAGLMGNRHIDVLANFCSIFSIPLAAFADKSVLDVGCWTGGTTLLLAALGSSVLAIEEVKKYAAMASFLSKSFGLEGRAAVESLSIYSCNLPALYDTFDIIYCPGVVYHLSDPLVALRILFNSLKMCGIILVESAGVQNAASICRFEGSDIYSSGTRENLDRVGWNWFVPSPLALSKMMREAGFEDVSVHWNSANNRLYAKGQKRSQVGICKAGLSLPSIR